jgi:hypothetical protein
MDALVAATRPPTSRTGRKAERRAERTWLARCDTVAARLAELHAMVTVLSDACDVVRHGWVQNGWFTVATPRGERLLLTYDAHRVTEQPITGACLVGSIVAAGGAPASSQLVQRTLDLTWHALHEDADRPAVLCPAPPVRAMRLRDLTRWNDHPRRQQDEVVDLLDRAGTLAATHAAAYRTERDSLVAGTAGSTRLEV